MYFYIIYSNYLKYINTKLIIFIFILKSFRITKYHTFLYQQNILIHKLLYSIQYSILN